MGAVNPASYGNLIGEGTGMTGITHGSNGNLVGTAAAPIDAKLGPLANNGGPTLTHALLPRSPAIDGAGHANLVAVATAPGLPAVQVYDGPTGALAQSFFLFPPFTTAGPTVAALDAGVHGQGYVDIVGVTVVGGWFVARGFDGRTAQALPSVHDFDPGFLGGLFIG